MVRKWLDQQKKNPNKRYIGNRIRAPTRTTFILPCVSFFSTLHTVKHVTKTKMSHWTFIAIFKLIIENPQRKRNLMHAKLHHVWRVCIKKWRRSGANGALIGYTIVFIASIGCFLISISKIHFLWVNFPNFYCK